jgi:Fic family protein
MMLGEAQSKCDHLAGVPLQPSLDSDLHALYLAKGVHATTAIEGNTLTEDQVRQRIQGQLELPASQEYMGKEIDNIVEACDVILKELVQGGATDLSMEEIKRFNVMVLKNLELDDGVVPGEIRKIMVGVARYRAVLPQHIEQLLEQMCRWLNHNDFKQDDRIAFGIFRAVLAHLYIAWIHPFGDGNGRTARLVEFKILLSHGVPSAAAHLLSNHYNQTRIEYYRQLDRASKSKGDVMPFIEYAVNGFIDGLMDQLMHVRSQQLKIAWRDYVYGSFRKKSGVNERRIKLALDISEHNGPVPLRDIRLLTPRLAELYAKKTYRAILRDVLVLMQMKLLIRRQKGYRPNWEILKGFLPICISPKADTNGKQKECISEVK